MQTTGYHTVENRDNADYVEENGPFIAKDRRTWYGTGYYFWDDDIERAHNWGKEIYPGKGYMICESDLHLDDDMLLDLCTREGIRALATLIEVLKSDPKSGYGSKNQPIGITIMYLRDLNRRWPQYKGIFPFNYVRGQDFPIGTMVEFAPGVKEKLSLNPRVQICLFEKSRVTVRSFCIIFPKEYVQE